MRYGITSPIELLDLAVKNEIETMVLTDINTSSACLEFVKEAQKRNIKPIVGIDVRNSADQLFVLIAKNNYGFEQINRFVSYHLHHKIDFEPDAPEFDDVIVIYPFEKGIDRKLRNNEYLGISINDIPILEFKNINPERGVVLQTWTFRNKKDFNAHRLLRAIDNNILLSKLPKTEEGNPNDLFVPSSEIEDAFKNYPQVIRNTQEILKTGTIDFTFGDSVVPQNQRYYTGSADEDIDLLRKLCADGLDYRYPELNEEICQRIDKELETIIQMGFVSYFLMNWDIVSYARSKGYYYVGRGSGANSVVAYLLRITDVDPIDLDLYFERFINLYRANPPDFDIDFSWRDREDVTQYIFNRFPNVALVATYNTFKHKSILRELGKVFGLPKEDLDKLTRGSLKPWEWSEIHVLVVKYAQFLQGIPNNLSIHASGIVISEQPIYAFSGTFMPPKGYPTIQFDMHIAEDVGLYKFDILSQRGLSKIKDAMEIIEDDVDIHNLTMMKQDEKIKELLRKGNAIGCFYVESPAMRMLLRKLQVDDYLGLVAASSIIRPGVAKSGMMHEYIRRYRHPEKRNDAHPVLLDLMPDTYGVMVYQEDVIKVAHYFAGLTLGEADKMRRGMSGKFRSRAEFEAVRIKFFENCKKKGHSEELTAEVWRQTESFAGYAFAKGHSASYAVESYQCLYLKAHYPLEFLTATINNYGGFYRTELYILEAKYLGAQIEPPCVNQSNFETVLKDKVIYLGLHLVKSFEGKTAKKISDERKANGNFESFDDFIERVPIGQEQLNLLIRVNAFRDLDKTKRELLWESRLKVSKTNPEELNHNLFRVPSSQYTFPELENSWQEDFFDQLELLNFPLYHPFRIVTEKINTPIVLAKDLPKYANKNVVIKGYLIHVKRTSTSNGKQMFFGTFLDENGDWLDSVHFPPIAQKFPFQGRGVYLIYGKVLLEYDCVNVETIKMKKMDVMEDPRYSVNIDASAETVTWNNRKTYQKDWVGQKNPPPEPTP